MCPRPALRPASGYDEGLAGVAVIPRLLEGQSCRAGTQCHLICYGAEHIATAEAEFDTLSTVVRQSLDFAKMQDLSGF